MKSIAIKFFDLFLNIYSFFYFTVFLTDYSFIFKKGISNIAGLSIAFIVFLFLRRILEKQNFDNLLIFKVIKKISRYPDRVMLCSIFIILFIILSGLGIARHLSFSSMAWDMGIFDQALWNTLRGDILFSSIRGNMSLLGDHFEPILLFILPFYALWPRVATLVIIQSAALALCVFMIYLIARDKIESRSVIFALIISFVLSKSVRGIGLSDFHLEGFMPFLSLGAFYTLVKDKKLLFSLAIFFLLLCKETTTLIVLALGLYAIFPLKRYRTGFLLLVLGVSAWILETKLLIPSFNVYKKFLYTVRMPFGDTYQENIKFIFSQPFEFFKFIFMPKKIVYIFKILGPVGLFPFFAPSEYILMALPMLSVLLASEKLWGYFLTSSHYVGHFIAFVYIAAIYGLARVLNFLKNKKLANIKVPLNRINLFLAMFIVVSSLMFYGKTDGHKFRKYLDGIVKYRSFERLSLLSIIPQSASVSASSNLVPHLSARKYVFEWDPESPLSLKTDYIVIDLNFVGYLKKGARNRIHTFFITAEEKGYKIILWREDLSLFILFNPENLNDQVVNFRANLGI